ncbi:serine/threonine protein kinase [Streptomyces roseirectus]|uniref:non-specific serine/threonine protein kinase n=1 Tax=Streptomyces roseirectus TaxID=2768066 RepID=A0A7H0IFN0_9ACTN|nr:serine/threonine-protein kinase [Streptomyces roseirectus]QNP71596.1 serine/threonine protein kinase [Streptomyces roseirectus]
MGEVFAGRYELVDPIGRGGVGAVWRAWDHRRRRYVAAKVLQQRDAHSLLRFVREQAVRIDHPNVLAPASWAADDDKVLFTMDLVSGGSLVHLIGDYGPLPPPFVCVLLDQLLAGLAAVHAEGVVHRDVKPANILLEATGTARPRLRLSDFGISMRLGEPRLTDTNLVVGTPGYIAPEQLLGADPDFPADLFAVGLVALYLLEGSKPDAKALIQHFAEHGTPGAPKGVPEPLWHVIASLLQPDPASRFRTATGARKALLTALELLPPTPDDESIEIFDQLGPLPKGFTPEGPTTTSLRNTAALREPPYPPLPDAPPTATWPGTTPTASVHTGWGPATPPSTPSTPTPAPTPTPTPTPTMSDTGSFHLPPPHPDPTPTPTPPPPPYDPTATYPLRPTTPHAPHTPATPSTATYTAAPTPPPPTPRTARHGRPAKSPRPGPPPRIAIPLLLFALTCYAIGFWALTRA